MYFLDPLKKKPRNITKIIKNWLQNFMLMANLLEINYIAFWQPFIIGFNEKKLRNIPSSIFGLHHFFKSQKIKKRQILRYTR